MAEKLSQAETLERMHEALAVIPRDRRMNLFGRSVFYVQSWKYLPTGTFELILLPNFPTNEEQYEYVRTELLTRVKAEGSHVMVRFMETWREWHELEDELMSAVTAIDTNDVAVPPYMSLNLKDSVPGVLRFPETFTSQSFDEALSEHLRSAFSAQLPEGLTASYVTTANLVPSAPDWHITITDEVVDAAIVGYVRKGAELDSSAELSEQDMADAIEVWQNDEQLHAIMKAALEAGYEHAVRHPAEPTTLASDGE